MVSISIVEFSIGVIVCCLTIWYGRGWRQVCLLGQAGSLPYADAPFFRTTNPRSLLLFGLAMGLLGVALISPLAALSTQFFLFRVLRHLTLNALVPCLLMLADPLPAFWRGLPASWRGKINRVADRYPTWVTGLRKINNRGVGLAGNIVCTLMWFDPTLHQAALEYRWVRAIEILVLLGGGVFYWHKITLATPQTQPPLPAIPHILYTGVGALPLKFAGIFFLFASTPLYLYPNPEIAGWGLSPLRSFYLGGGLIWLLGGAAYSYTAAYFLGNWFGGEEAKPPLPPRLWDTPEAMVAPGFD